MVDCDEPGVKVDGRKLVITPEESRRLVVYSVTDQDGLVGHAVVSVPGTERSRPTLDPTKVPIQVRAGQEFSLDLNELVLTRTGRSPHLNNAETVRVSVGLEDPPAVKNDHEISVRVQPDFVGDTGLTLEVSDGTGEDRSALQANLTIPIQVTPSVNQPPVLTPTPIEVAMGEGAVVADLAQMVTDPDGADPAGFTYKLVSGISDVTARLDGHQLSVEVPVNHDKGPAGDLKVSVDDGSGEVVGTFPVIVKSSNRPLVMLNDAFADDVNAGTTKTIDIATYAINPFPQTPLVVQKTWVVTGSGVTITHHGTKIMVTVPRNFHGPVEAAYNVMDATRDPDRVVRGKISLVVRDRPDPPTDVEVDPNGAGSAMVRFQPGANNGSEIDRFELTSDGKTYSCKSGTPPCEVNGLANGVKHSFTVRAGNAVGLSDPSEPSPAVLIDVPPERPSAPDCEPGDGQITCTWKEPSNKGSAVQEYILSVGGAGTEKVDGSRRSATITGLNNGTDYWVTVQAKNGSEQPSEPSEKSASVTPFGRPSGPESISVNLLSPDDSRAKVEATWHYPGDNNGRDWDQARISYDGQSVEVSASPSDNSKVIYMSPSQSATVSVALRTTSQLWSESKSFTFVAASVPVQIETPNVKATGNDNEVAVSNAKTRGGNGYNSSQLVLQYSTGGDWQNLSGSTIGGLANGNSVRIKFRQVAPGASYAAIGPEVQADAVTPYGPPKQPKLEASAISGGVHFKWTAEKYNGGPPVTKIVLTVGSNSSNHTDLEGSADITATAGEQLRGTVKACYDNGTCTESEAAQATAGA